MLTQSVLRQAWIGDQYIGVAVFFDPASAPAGIQFAIQGDGLYSGLLEHTLHTILNVHVPNEIGIQSKNLPILED